MNKFLKVLLFTSIILTNQLQAQLPNNHLRNLVSSIPSPIATSITPKLSMSIDPYTGTNSLGLDLFNYSDPSRGLEHSISLNYVGGGIKVDDIASNVGLGWNLNTGGIINRSVKGLPDEMPERGFMDRPLTDTTDLYDLYAEYGDGQIDQFSYVAGNHAGQFVIGKNGQALTIPRNNFKIERTIVVAPGGSCPIIHFKITDDKGMQYFYQGYDCMEQPDDAISASFFLNTSYYLTWIVSPFNTDTIYFDYTTKATNTYYQGNSSVKYTTGAYTNTFSDNVTSTIIAEKRLSAIRYPDGTTVTFNYDTFKRLDLPAENGISSIVISNGTSSYGYKLGFAYFGSTMAGLSGTTNDITYQNYDAQTTILTSHSHKYRLKLKSFWKYSGTTNLKPYQFAYNNGNFYERGFDQKIDAWGYQSSTASSTVSSSRPAELAGSKTGVLESITYPEGGSTTWEYELHTTSSSLHPDRVFDAATLIGSLSGVPVTTITNYLIRQLGPFTMPSPSGVESIYNNIKLTPGPEDGGMPSCWSSGKTFTVRLLKSINSVYTNIASISFSSTELMALTPKYIEVEGKPGDLFKLEYEINSTCASPMQPDYYMQYDWKMYSEPKSGKVGGLRVKKETTYDGVNHSKDVIKEYRYIASNASSGVMANYPVRTYNYDEVFKTGTPLPAHGFPTYYASGQVVPSPPDNTTYNFVVNTDNALNLIYQPGGGVIGYGRVIEYMGSAATNNGKAIYEFNTFNESSLLTNSKANIAPFTPQPIASFKYGLPLKTLIYDQSGNLKSKIENTYYISATKITDPAYRSIKILFSKKGYPNLPDGSSTNDIFLKGLYYPVTGKTFLTNRREVEYFTGDSLVTNTSIVSDTVNLVTQSVQITNSAGELITQKNYYVFQYNIAGAITSLKNANNKFFPVTTEKWKKKGLNNPELINFNAIDFKSIGNGSVKTDNIYEFKISSPLAEASWGSFDPTLILRPMPMFDVGMNMVSYDADGNPLEINRKGVSESMLWGYKQSRLIAKISNAAASEVGYTSFESEDQNLWKPYVGGATTSTVEKHTGNTSLKISENSDGLVRKFNPTATNSQSKKYVFSCWVKTPTNYTGTGNIIIHTTDNTDPSTAVYPVVSGSNLSVSITNTSGNWKYMQVIIDLAAIHTTSGIGTPFRIRVRIENLSGSKPAYIDDIRFYPMDAMMESYTCDPLFGITSVSDENNLVTTYEFDAFGRLKFSKDQDGKILERKEYNDAQ